VGWLGSGASSPCWDPSLIAFRLTSHPPPAHSDSRSTDLHPIRRCETCDKAYHACCLGAGMPLGAWLCRKHWREKHGLVHA